MLFSLCKRGHAGILYDRTLLIRHFSPPVLVKLKASHLSSYVFILKLELENVVRAHVGLYCRVVGLRPLSQSSKRTRDDTKRATRCENKQTLTCC